MTDATKRHPIARASWMFRGSRDFFLAYELLAAFRQSPEARAGRAPRPVQSEATCAALALELALKCRIVLDGREPPSRGRAGHSCEALFRALSATAREDITSLLLVNGKPAMVEGLLQTLSEFEGTFQNWRYMHEYMDEKGTVSFHEGNMVAVITALYHSIVRLRPDFGPWPGVIVDPERPVRWHLKLP